VNVLFQRVVVVEQVTTDEKVILVVMVKLVYLGLQEEW
jgi:hypothetical protein